MHDRAYIVALIKRGEPSTVVGAGIFGEPHPTTNGLVTLEIYRTAEYDSFDVALKSAQDALLDPSFAWCGPVKVDPARGVYRDARGL
jgi:hypothetical protein